MKWVVGSVAVLVALVIGIAIGWTMRDRAEPRNHVVYTSSPPPPPSSPPPPITAPTATATTHAWIEDTETFAWPSSAADDVVVVDATHYLVKRAYLVKVTSNNDGVGSSRIVPAFVDGGIVGVKVFGIRAGSATAKLGLQNGDTVKTLNGISIAKPDDALEAYSHVRDGKTFSLSIERAGAPIDLHYRVLD